MPEKNSTIAQPAAPLTAREWAQNLAKYRNPNNGRAIFEIVVTVAPFLALWALAWWSISISPFLAIAIATVNAGFLVRLFAVQHDCGHGSFLGNSTAADWVGRILGVLTLTPYAVWRKVHSVHHSASGNLDKRGMGEVHTKTVDEYLESTPWQKFGYRLYRSPIVLFGLAPTYLFVLQNRLPVGLMKDGPKYWLSAMGTNLSIACLLGPIYYLGGWQPLVLVFAPTVFLGASIGVWLFYIQHQFEDSHFDFEPEWNIQDAAFHGSSHYQLPAILNWLTANIGVHHVHHLNCRIPFYRLPEVLSDHAALNQVQTLSIRESIACANLNLWDEKQRKLLSFANARALYQSK